MQFNRRDLGYSIISRFETDFRKFISNNLYKFSNNFKEVIPKGIIEKALIRDNSVDVENIDDLLENTDFPDLAEICCYNNNYKLLFNNDRKSDFSEIFAVLYSLRCKIAHVKGFFTSIDLDKLIDLSKIILKETGDATNLNQLIENLESDPEKYILKIPFNFNIDYLANNGILNNLPIPDYEYEGGFVGREEDIKKITTFLISDKFPVITITGAGGVGKTSLALKVIQELTQNPDFNNFDAIIWLSAKENRLTHLGIEDIEPSIKSYEELLDTIIGVLNFDIENTIAKKEATVNAIFELSKGILIVIDNLETITDERIINFIIESPKSAKFLITSRKGLGQVERRHELKQLKEKEAIYLFRQTARDKQLNHLSRLDDAVIRKYVNKVSCFPLAIKWVLGLVARGKDINSVIDSINDATGDIAKFCFSAIFSDLSDNCKLILYSICCFDSPPTDGVLKYVVEIEQNDFEDGIEELIIVSLIIPEQFKNEQDEIAVKYSIIPLTKGYIRQQLNKNINLKQKIERTIAATQSTIADTEKAKTEYRYSLNNMGAITEEEKVAAILIQTALQKYQAGFYEDAVDNYKSAIRIAPRFSTIYRNWAVMESMEGHWDEADTLIEKAKDLSPNDPQIWLLWGNIHKKASKFTQAHEKYETAHKIAPSDHIILNAFAQIKNRLGQYEIANSLFQKALEIGIQLSSQKHEIINRSSLAENLLNWSDFLAKDRNYFQNERKLKLAKEQIDYLIELDPKDPTSIALLAQCYFKLGLYYKRIGKPDMAIENFKHLIQPITMSNKEDYYIVNGTLEYVSLTLNDLGYFELYEMLLPLKINFPNVFQKTANILERYDSIINILNDKKREDGKSIDHNISDYFTGIITKVDSKRKFVIIESLGKTLLGHTSKFDPPVKILDKNFIRQHVMFTTYKRNDIIYAGNIILLNLRIKSKFDWQH